MSTGPEDEKGTCGRETVPGTSVVLPRGARETDVSDSTCLVSVRGCTQTRSYCGIDLCEPLHYLGAWPWVVGGRGAILGLRVVPETNTRHTGGFSPWATGNASWHGCMGAELRSSSVFLIRREAGLHYRAPGAELIV
ncbi:hypothetical protein DPEC_G00348790 [Dallia pectoralis]|uniref:Uncharacterized protein n=1 Tax=Dallia pectoralis TaxID=75939 RepID=A0ACC2F193_DALPE|nr:hypothetical protein DPEC_G00348790 [Dallia pectoralis]